MQLVMGPKWPYLCQRTVIIAYDLPVILCISHCCFGAWCESRPKERSVRQIIHNFFF